MSKKLWTFSIITFRKINYLFCTVVLKIKTHHNNQKPFLYHHGCSTNFNHKTLLSNKSIHLKDQRPCFFFIEICYPFNLCFHSLVLPSWNLKFRTTFTHFSLKQMPLLFQLHWTKPATKIITTCLISIPVAAGGTSFKSFSKSLTPIYSRKH